MKKELKLQLSVTCPSCGNLITVTTAADGSQTAVCQCATPTPSTNVSSSSIAGLPSATQTAHVSTRSEKRLAALIAAGIDVTGMAALNIGGIDTIVRNANGKIEMVADDDPIFAKIKAQGYTFQARMHKQWVMSQLLDAAWNDNNFNIDNGIWRNFLRGQRFTDTDQVLKLFCDKQLEIAAATRNGDESISDDARYYNQQLYVFWCRKTYMPTLHQLLETCLERKNCKGKSYIRVPKPQRTLGVSRQKYKGTFIADLRDKVYKPLLDLIDKIESAKSPIAVYKALCAFREKAVIIYHYTTCLNTYRHKKERYPVLLEITGKAFENAFTGYGVFFTMQNMIRFHGCTLEGCDDMQSSEALLNEWAARNADSSWWMWGALKRMIYENSFSFRAKQAEWRKH